MLLPRLPTLFSKWQHFDNQLESTPESRYQQTKDKESYYYRLKQNGVLPHMKLVIMWECDFTKIIKSNNYCQQRQLYWITLCDIGHCDPAYFGERTENTIFYKECPPGYSLRHLDVTSLSLTSFTESNFLWDILKSYLSCVFLASDEMRNDLVGSEISKTAGAEFEVLFELILILHFKIGLF